MSTPKEVLAHSISLSSVPCPHCQSRKKPIYKREVIFPVWAIFGFLPIALSGWILFGSLTATTGQGEIAAVAAALRFHSALQVSVFFLLFGFGVLWFAQSRWMMTYKRHCPECGFAIGKEPYEYNV
jgi:hypothetical protein